MAQLAEPSASSLEPLFVSKTAIDTCNAYPTARLFPIHKLKDQYQVCEGAVPAGLCGYMLYLKNDDILFRETKVALHAVSEKAVNCGLFQHALESNQGFSE